MTVSMLVGVTLLASFNSSGAYPAMDARHRFAFVVGGSVDETSKRRPPFEGDATLLGRCLTESGFVVWKSHGDPGGTKQTWRERVEARAREIGEHASSMKEGSESDVLVIVFFGRIRLRAEGAAPGSAKIALSPYDSGPEQKDESVLLDDLVALARGKSKAKAILIGDDVGGDPAIYNRSAESLRLHSELPAQTSLLIGFCGPEGPDGPDGSIDGNGRLLPAVVRALEGAGTDGLGRVTWERIVNFAFETAYLDRLRRTGGRANAEIRRIGAFERDVALLPARGIKPPTLLVVPFNAESARRKQEEWARFLRLDAWKRFDGNENELVLVPPGEFLMKFFPLTDLGNTHVIQRPVRISAPFWLGRTEMTQVQCTRLLGRNPSRFKWAGIFAKEVKGLETERFPVEAVTWWDAIDVCNRLSVQSALRPYYKLDVQRVDEDRCICEGRVAILGGNGYRLPTSAEWEFAARAGTTTTFSWGDATNGSQANVASVFPESPLENNPHIYRGRPIPVGSFSANAFDLFDTAGNVDEWCWDWHYRNAKIASGVLSIDPTGPEGPDPNFPRRALRGGGYNAAGGQARSDSKFGASPGSAAPDVGLRICRSM